MIASMEMNDPVSAQTFSERIVQQNILNRKIEKGIRAIYPRTSIFSIVQIYRTDIVLLLFGIVSALCLLSLKKRRFMPWVGIFSVAGLALFLL
jgi:hypothetical protein